MGDTATRWEGDTLVLETISFDTRPWIQGGGVQDGADQDHRAFAAALEKLPRIPAHGRGPQHVDETVDVDVARVFAGPPMRT